MPDLFAAVKSHPDNAKEQRHIMALDSYQRTGKLAQSLIGQKWGIQLGVGRIRQLAHVQSDRVSDPQGVV